MFSLMSLVALGYKYFCGIPNIWQNIIYFKFRLELLFNSICIHSFLLSLKYFFNTSNIILVRFINQILFIYLFLCIYLYLSIYLLFVVYYLFLFI